VQPLAAQADFSSLEGTSWRIPRDKRSLRRKDQDAEALEISCGAQVGGGLFVATRVSRCRVMIQKLAWWRRGVTGPEVLERLAQLIEARRLEGGCDVERKRGDRVHADGNETRSEAMEKGQGPGRPRLAAGNCPI